MRQIKTLDGIMSLDESNDIIGQSHHKEARNGVFKGNTPQMHFTAIRGNSTIANPNLIGNDCKIIGSTVFYPNCSLVGSAILPTPTPTSTPTSSPTYTSTPTYTNTPTAGAGNAFDFAFRSSSALVCSVGSEPLQRTTMYSNAGAADLLNIAIATDKSGIPALKYRLFTDVDMTTFKQNGFYSDGTYYYNVTGGLGLITNADYCFGPTPTSTSTSTPTATPTPPASFNLGYSSVSGVLSCAAAQSVYYAIPGSVLELGTQLYSDPSLGAAFLVPNGYYADGSNYYHVYPSNGQIHDIGFCPTFTPTATSTPTPTVGCFLLMVNVSSVDRAASDDGYVYFDYNYCGSLTSSTIKYNVNKTNFNTGVCYDMAYGVPTVYYYISSVKTTAPNSSAYMGVSCVVTPSPTSTATTTATPTSTATPTNTPTSTPTGTATPTFTPTPTRTPTETPTYTPTTTPTFTPTAIAYTVIKGCEDYAGTGYIKVTGMSGGATGGVLSWYLQGYDETPRFNNQRIGSLANGVYKLYITDGSYPITEDILISCATYTPTPTGSPTITYTPTPTTTWNGFAVYKGTNPATACTATDDPYTLYYVGALAVGTTTFYYAPGGAVANSGYYYNPSINHTYTVNGSGLYVGDGACPTYQVNVYGKRNGLAYQTTASYYSTDGFTFTSASDIPRITGGLLYTIYVPSGTTVYLTQNDYIDGYYVAATAQEGSYPASASGGNCQNTFYITGNTNIYLYADTAGGSVC